MYVLLSGRPVFEGFKLETIIENNRTKEVEYPEKYWSKISS